MTPSEILTKAKEIISPPGNWTQHASARDSTGDKVIPKSPAAVCWCATGAINSFADELKEDGTMVSRIQDTSLAIDYLAKSIKLVTEQVPDRLAHDKFRSERIIVAFNDTKGRHHEEIVKRFDQAISLAEEGESTLRRHQEECAKRFYQAIAKEGELEK